MQTLISDDIDGYEMSCRERWEFFLLCSSRLVASQFSRYWNVAYIWICSTYKAERTNLCVYLQDVFYPPPLLFGLVGLINANFLPHYNSVSLELLFPRILTLSEMKLAFPQNARSFRLLRLTKAIVLPYDWLKATTLRSQHLSVKKIWIPWPTNVFHAKWISAVHGPLSSVSLKILIL